MKLLLLIFLLSPVAFAIEPERGAQPNCSRLLLPEARARRTQYVQTLRSLHMENLRERPWERFVPRIRRWITESPEEGIAVQRFARSFFFEFSEVSLVLNDSSTVDFALARLVVESVSAPGIVLSISVSPGSTLEDPKFEALFEFIQSLMAEGRLILIVYESQPTAFDL